MVKSEDHRESSSNPRLLPQTSCSFPSLQLLLLFLTSHSFTILQTDSLSACFTRFTLLRRIFVPKTGPFSSLTRSTPPDPRWVLYLPGALALCPLLTPISQPLSLAAGNIQAEMLPSRNIVFFTQQQQYTSLAKLGKQCFIDLYPPANTLSNR